MPLRTKPPPAPDYRPARAARRSWTNANRSLTGFCSDHPRPGGSKFSRCPGVYVASGPAAFSPGSWIFAVSRAPASPQLPTATAFPVPAAFDHFSHSVRQVLLGLVLLFLYGGVLVGVLPGQPGVSWQGHLFGAIGGVLAAWWLGPRDRDGRTAAWK